MPGAASEAGSVNCQVPLQSIAGDSGAGSVNFRVPLPSIAGCRFWSGGRQLWRTPSVDCWKPRGAFIAWCRFGAGSVNCSVPLRGGVRQLSGAASVNCSILLEGRGMSIARCRSRGGVCQQAGAVAKICHFQDQGRRRRTLCICPPRVATRAWCRWIRWYIPMETRTQTCPSSTARGGAAVAAVAGHAKWRARPETATPVGWVLTLEQRRRCASSVGMARSHRARTLCGHRC